MPFPNIITTFDPHDFADVQGPDEGGAADHERAQHPREPPGGAARDGQLRRRPGMGFNAVVIEV